MRRESSITDNTVTISSSTNIGPDVSLVSFQCPPVARNAKPGNFVNIKISPQNQPLLRRPFSIHYIDGDRVDIMAKSVGCGTSLLCGSPVGAELQVLGPLGNAFTYDDPHYQTALLVSGGIGSAPMRFLEKHIRAQGKKVCNIIGGRTRQDIRTEGLMDCMTATEDGSKGFKGTAIGLLRDRFDALCDSGSIRVFACGPNPMLKALAEFCRDHGVPCEVSLESVMGCGIGICYGCTVEVRNPGNSGTSTILLCREGPVLDAERLLF